MSFKTWPPKDPNETLDYGIDWSPRLVVGETIVTSVWIIPNDLSSTDDSIVANSTNTVVWLVGGVEGETYIITNRITTSFDRIYDQSVKLKVRSR